MSKRVFISYRREDTAAPAGRVYDRLRRILPSSSIYFDVSTTKGGEDFKKRIMSEIASSDVVLVFIGKNWMMPAREGGQPRISEPNDYVCAELRAALARPITVLPILVDGAKMADPDLLPVEVRSIATRNALPLRHDSFDADTETIVGSILGIAGKQRPWDDKYTLVTKLASAGIGSIVALVLLGLCALAHFLIFARPLSASIGAPGTTLLLIAGAILGAWIGLRYAVVRHRRRLGS